MDYVIPDRESVDLEGWESVNGQEPSQTSSSPLESASGLDYVIPDCESVDLEGWESVNGQEPSQTSSAPSESASGLDYETPDSDSVDLEGWEKVHAQEPVLTKDQSFSRFTDDMSDFKKEGISWRLYAKWNNSILGKMPKLYATAPFKKYREGVSVEKDDSLQKVPDRAPIPLLGKDNLSSQNIHLMRSLAVSVNKMQLDGSQPLKGWFYRLMFHIFN